MNNFKDYQMIKVKEEDPKSFLIVLRPENSNLFKPKIIIKEEKDASVITIDSDTEEEEEEEEENHKYQSCSKCKRIFSYQGHFRSHIKRKCKKNMKQCKKCLEVWFGLKTLKEHICKLHQCKTCYKTFSSKTSLKTHGILHDRKLEKCPHCSRKFTKNRLQKHIDEIHLDEKKFSCDLCKFKSSALPHMERHMQVHLKFRPYICKICKKGFIEFRYFKEHKLNHTDPKPFKCDKCGSCYTRKTSINRHMLTAHSKNRPFKCDQCKYAGKTQNDLTTHKMSHTKAYVCKICSRKFSRISLLKEHQILHENPNAYRCKICKSRFSQKKTLKDHLKKHKNFLAKKL